MKINDFESYINFSIGDKFKNYEEQLMQYS